MRWTIQADEYYLYDTELSSADNRYLIFDPSISKELNKASTFTTTILPSHPTYSLLERLKTHFSIYRDEELVFRGRLLDDKLGWKNEKKIVCESELAYLNDTVQRPYTFPIDEDHTSVADYFSFLIARHNEQVNSDRQFVVGSVTVIDANNYIARSDTEYQTTWSLLMDLVSTMGGYIIPRYVNDVCYLDYLADIPQYSNQPIELGLNLLSLSTERKGAEIITALVPLGYQPQNEEGESLPRITVSDLPDEVAGDIRKLNDFVYSVSAVNKYGWIFGTNVWDDVTEKQNLLRKAKDMLSEKILISSTVELSAADLSGAGYDVEAFELGRYVEFKDSLHSDVHALESRYLIKKIVIKPFKPGDNKITVGATTTSFTENNRVKQDAARREILLDTKNRTDSINNRVTQVKTELSTAISQTDADITAVASRVDSVEDTAEELSSSVATLQLTADGLTTSVTRIDSDIANLQAQIDDAVETYSGSAVPTLQNEPAVNWTTTAQRDSHVGDLYLVNSEGGAYANFYYRFEKLSSGYQWTLVEDTAVTQALAEAQAARAEAAAAQQAADDAQADATSAQNRLDNLKLGARNLVANSSKEISSSLTSKGKAIVFLQLTDYGKSVLKQSGVKVSVSYEAKADVDGVNVSFRLMKSGNSVTSTYKLESLTTSWNRFYLEDIATTSTDTARIRFWQSDFSDTIPSGAKTYLRNVKVELGSISTDYTIAPEDAEAEVAAAQTAADNAQTAADNAAQDAIDKSAAAQAAAEQYTRDQLANYPTKEEVTSEINQKADEINITVRQVETYANTAQATANQAQETANFASTSASTAQSTANQANNKADTVQRNVSRLSVTVNGISSEVSTKVGETEVQSLIEQNAESIRLQATALSWESEHSTLSADGVLQMMRDNAVSRVGLSEYYLPHIFSGTLWKQEASGFYAKAEKTVDGERKYAQISLIPSIDPSTRSTDDDAVAARLAAKSSESYRESVAIGDDTNNDVIVYEKQIDDYGNVNAYMLDWNDNHEDMIKNQYSYHIGHAKIWFQDWTNDWKTEPTFDNDTGRQPWIKFTEEGFFYRTSNASGATNKASLQHTGVSPVKIVDSSITLVNGSVRADENGFSVSGTDAGITGGTNLSLYSKKTSLRVEAQTSDSGQPRINIKANEDTEKGYNGLDFYISSYNNSPYMYVNSSYVQFQSTSSRRYKHNISENMLPELDPHRLYNLKPVQFAYNDGAPLQYVDMRGKTIPGFIAEDVAEIYPAAVIHNIEGHIESWDERRIIPGMLALIQEQKKEIEELKNMVLELTKLVKGGEDK